MDELIKALETIKAECENHADSCEGCPLWIDDIGCGVRDDIPSTWEIKEPVVRIMG